MELIDMYLITNEHSELIKSLTFAIKLNKHNDFIDYYQRQYQENPDNAEAAFSYGACMGVRFQLETVCTENPKLQMQAIKALSDCLNYCDEHWLARHMRNEIANEYPEGLINMSGKVTSDHYISVDVLKECDKLIDMQYNIKIKPVYFLCPYFSKARAYIYKGDFKRAKESWEEGIDEIGIKTSEYDFGYLTQPFFQLILILRKLEYNSEAERLRNIAEEIFPDSVHILMA